MAQYCMSARDPSLRTSQSMIVHAGAGRQATRRTTACFSLPEAGMDTTSSVPCSAPPDAETTAPLCAMRRR